MDEIDYKKLLKGLIRGQIFESESVAMPSEHFVVKDGELTDEIDGTEMSDKEVCLFWDLTMEVFDELKNDDIDDKDCCDRHNMEINTFKEKFFENFGPALIQEGEK